MVQHHVTTKTSEESRSLLPTTTLNKNFVDAKNDKNDVKETILMTTPSKSGEVIDQV